jgi:hypothetical protein
MIILMGDMTYMMFTVTAMMCRSMGGSSMVLMSSCQLDLCAARRAVVWDGQGAADDHADGRNDARYADNHNHDD